MRKPDCAIGCVDALAAVACTPIDVNPQILGTNVDIDILGFGQHSYRCRRGVNPPAGFGHRYALNPVHTAFELQLAVSAGTVDLEHDFLEAARLAFAGVHDVNLP